MNRYGVLNVLIVIGLVASVIAVDCNNPPERTDLQKCCPHDSLISKAIADKCSSYLTSESTPPPPPAGDHHGPHGPRHHPSPCYMECVMNETGIMNGDDIDEAKLKAYLSTVLSANPDFMQVVQNGFKMCAEKRKEIRAMMEKNPPPSPPPNMGDGKMCKPCSAMLMHCVDMETFINCPSSAWKNDDACNDNRAFVKDCKPPHPPHGGKPPM